MHFRVLAQRYLVASCRVNVRFGSEADMCTATGNVRYGPIEDIPAITSVQVSMQPRAVKLA